MTERLIMSLLLIVFTNTILNCYTTLEIEVDWFIFFLDSNATVTKIKHFQCCLEILIELKHIFEQLADKKIELSEEDIAAPAANNSEPVSFKNCYSLLNLVRQRLQYVLRTMIKLCLSKQSATKDSPKYAELYKACYILTFELVDGLEFYVLVDKLKNILGDIELKLNELKSIT